MSLYKLSAYPKVIKLASGKKITVRPMVKGDEKPLLEFMLGIPEQDRYYLKEDVTSPKVIRQWCEHLDYDRALPVLALDGKRIVADGTLHQHRAGARKHVGQLRILVHPDYRNSGLGSAVLHELTEIAHENGLERLTFEAVAGKEDAAIVAAERLGFVPLAALPGHARDSKGKPHNIVLLEMPLGKWYEWWGPGPAF